MAAAIDRISNAERKTIQKRAYHTMHRKGHGVIVGVVHKKTPSSTTGRSKGIKATPIQRGMCRRNRSWKHPDYVAVMASLGKRGGKKA